MENTTTHFETDVENLSYYKVEGAILRYFDMGMPNTSNIPPEMAECIAAYCCCREI